ncbi:UNVERIFIED_CONTAM: hypothetical protein FKN15_066912 [Acipenser sinensis]
MFLLLCESQSANPVFPTPAASRARSSASKAQPPSTAQYTTSAAALATAAVPAFQLHSQRFQSQRQAPVTLSVQSSPTLSLSPNLLMDQHADEPLAADEHESSATDKYAANLSMLHREIFSDIKGLLQPLTESVLSLSSPLQSIEAQLGHGHAPALPALA